MVEIKKLEPIGGTISVVNVPVAVLTASNMPMRDYFAAKAMLGILTAPHRKVKAGHGEVASYAYSLADAMLAAREQK